MKITTNFFYQTFFAELNKQIESMYKAHRQLASGKRVLSPSDDPIAISRILRYKSQLSALEEYSRVLDTAKILNSSLEASLNDLKGIVIKAKQFAMQGSTDTLSATNRLAISREIDTLIQRSLDTINTQVSGRYIFSGLKGNLAPVNNSSGVYLADSNLQYLDINFFLDVAVNLPATEFFSYKVDPNDPNISLRVFTPYNYNFSADPNGVYDADPLSALLMKTPPGGEITDPMASFTANGGTITFKFSNKDSIDVSISPNASLNEIRDAINTQAGSIAKAWVVNVGTSEAPDYRLVIGSKPNGKSNMLRITVNSIAGDNLNLLAYAPESGYVSMSLEANIKGYNYITDPTDENYYSFNNNFLNENYYLRTLHFLRVALENNDQGRIQKAVEYIDRIADKLLSQQSIIGARLNKLENVFDFNLELSTNTQQNLSNDQDADAVKLVSELNQRMSVLQALRTTFTDFFRSNLFDFLR